MRDIEFSLNLTREEFEKLRQGDPLLRDGAVRLQCVHLLPSGKLPFLWRATFTCSTLDALQSLLQLCGSRMTQPLFNSPMR